MSVVVPGFLRQCGQVGNLILKAVMQKYKIQLETPVVRPPVPGQTETLIPPSALDEFNAIMNVSHH